MNKGITRNDRTTSDVSIRRWLIAAGIAAVAQIGLLWGTSLPLGVPGEWTWARTDFVTFDWLGIWPSVLVGAALFWYVRLVSRWIDSAQLRSRIAALLGLWLLGALWLFSLVSSVPGIAGLSRAPFVLYYSRSSGYFTQARDEVVSVREFLSTYRERIADSEKPENYLHMGTHPPGLTLAYVGMIELCERSSGFRELLLKTQPRAIRDAIEVIAENHADRDSALMQVDAAVLWLATLFTGLAAAGTSVPLFLLAQKSGSFASAWWIAAFWLLVPATAVFFPKSDVLFPWLAMWAQWQWLQAIDTRSPWWGAAAGATMFVAVCLTLAFVPIGLILVLQWFCVSDSSSDANRGAPLLLARLRSRLVVAIAAAMAFVVLLGLCWGAGGMNLVSVWMQNLKNHAAFYGHATRSYVPWLLVNPLEAAFSLGLPITVMVIQGMTLIRVSGVRESMRVLIPVLVWGVLWLSGKNMGEAARLWVFLMPYGVWAAGPALSRFCQAPRGSWAISFLYLVQLVVCGLTVLRVDGFHFAELAG